MMRKLGIDMFLNKEGLAGIKILVHSLSSYFYLPYPFYVTNSYTWTAIIKSFISCLYDIGSTRGEENCFLNFFSSAVQYGYRLQIADRRNAALYIKVRLY